MTAASLRRELTIGFLVWLSLVVALEPGNIARALSQGATLPLGQEIFRLLAAGALGASVTPLAFLLARRWPLRAATSWRNASLLAAGYGALTVALLVVSCGLADLFLPEEHRPLLTAIREQIVADGPLLFACLAGLGAVAHWRTVTPDPAPPSHLTSVSVKLRNAIHVVQLSEVRWIETQGNYLALHTGDHTHLLRETSARLEQRIDPERFLRIHRQTLVAVSRMRALAPLAGGDAMLTLDDGTELRVSRTYRNRVRSLLA
jgi:DNA-binding LytR/AlgR family response regulator